MSSTHTGFWLKTGLMWFHTLLLEFAPEYAELVENEDGEVDFNLTISHILEADISEWLSEETKTAMSLLMVDTATGNWTGAGYVAEEWFFGRITHLTTNLQPLQWGLFLVTYAAYEVIIAPS